MTLTVVNTVYILDELPNKACSISFIFHAVKQTLLFITQQQEGNDEFFVYSH